MDKGFLRTLYHDFRCCEAELGEIYSDMAAGEDEVDTSEEWKKDKPLRFPRKGDERGGRK